MFPFFLAAYFTLIRFGLYVARKDFPRLYDTVRNCRTKGTEDSVTLDRICRAMDLACVWYFRPVLCLQRSAATTWLLRKHGVPARLVIGAQHTPFRAHAWVEVHDRVVNDKPYLPQIYGVLDRC